MRALREFREARRDIGLPGKFRVLREEFLVFLCEFGTGRLSHDFWNIASCGKRVTLKFERFVTLHIELGMTRRVIKRTRGGLVLNFVCRGFVQVENGRTRGGNVARKASVLLGGGRRVGGRSGKGAFAREKIVWHARGEFLRHSALGERVLCSARGVKHFELFSHLGLNKGYLLKKLDYLHNEINLYEIRGTNFFRFFF